ncbi:MAG: hypothetical protein P4L99_28000 [Chthoniobacter sp.]|nr:hypothetical protein [Chthoniobacter sp.]
MSPKLKLSETILTQKEAAFALRRSRTTLWRRKREGLPFVDGRIGAETLAWFMEVRDAAKKLGKPIKDVMQWPRDRQEQLLKQAAKR